MLLLGNLDNRSYAGLSYLQLNNGLDNANWNIGGRAYGRIFFNVNKALGWQQFCICLLLHNSINLSPVLPAL